MKNVWCIQLLTNIQLLVYFCSAQIYWERQVSERISLLCNLVQTKRVVTVHWSSVFFLAPASDALFVPFTSRREAILEADAAWEFKWYIWAWSEGHDLLMFTHKTCRYLRIISLSGSGIGGYFGQTGDGHLVISRNEHCCQSLDGRHPFAEKNPLFRSPLFMVLYLLDLTNLRALNLDTCEGKMRIKKRKKMCWHSWKSFCIPLKSCIT